MRITLYLLRRDTDLTEACLRNPEKFGERPLIPAEEGLLWRLFVYPGETKPTRWSSAIGTILADPGDQESISGRTPGAVLLIQAFDRVFAVTFGTGFHAIDQELLERDFGLRVAASCIDPSRVSLADARGLGKGRRNALSRLPLPNEMSALGLLVDEEWIRKIGGEVQTDGFAKTASGADSLLLNIQDFSFSQLSGILATALALHESDDYQQQFPFLNYFRRETDKRKLEELDNAITESMRARDPEAGFAVPDESSLIADSFIISRGNAKYHASELSTEEVYKALDKIKGWTAPLTKTKITALDISGEMVGGRDDLRNYTVGFHRGDFDGKIQDYALTAGSWFRINDDYVSLVN